MLTMLTQPRQLWPQLTEVKWAD